MSVRAGAFRPIVVLVLVALTVIVLAGCQGATVASPSSELTPALPTGTPPPPQARDTATPDSTLGPEPTWVRVTDQSSFGDSLMYAVAAGVERYVATGEITVGDSTLRGAIWTSTDGWTWTRVVVPSAAGASIGGVIFDQIGYVAWGSFLSMAGTSSSAAIWTSRDGVTWRQAVGPPSFAFSEVAGIARVGDRLVAVGSSDDEDGRALVAFRAWTSTDGETWVPAGSPSISNPDQVYVDGLAVFDGELIGWGSYDAGDRWSAAIARSPDGLHWTFEALDSAPFANPWIADVLVDGDVLVAVGGDAEEGIVVPSSAAWTSSDGVTWEPAAIIDAVGDLHKVVRWGAELIALDGVPQMRSVDGRTWNRGGPGPDIEGDGQFAGECVDGPCQFRTMLSDLAVGPAGPVAVGHTSLASGGSRSVVWILR